MRTSLLGVQLDRQITWNEGIERFVARELERGLERGLDLGHGIEL